MKKLYGHRESHRPGRRLRPVMDKFECFESYLTNKKEMVKKSLLHGDLKRTMAGGPRLQTDANAGTQGITFQRHVLDEKGGSQVEG